MIFKISPTSIEDTESADGIVMSPECRADFSF